MDDVRRALESYLRGISTMTISIPMPAEGGRWPTTVQFSADPVMGKKLAFEMYLQLRRDAEFAAAMRELRSQADSVAGDASTAK